jgi:hypothetical protein
VLAIRTGDWLGWPWSSLAMVSFCHVLWWQWDVVDMGRTGQVDALAMGFLCYGLGCKFSTLVLGWSVLAVEWASLRKIWLWYGLAMGCTSQGIGWQLYEMSIG